MLHRLMALAVILLSIVMAPPTTAQTPDPATLPLLAPGQHLGTTFFGGGRVPDDPATLVRMQEAAAAGMSAFSFYEDWAELEPTPGQYYLDDLRASLEYFNRLGIQPFLNITFIDIADLTLPADLIAMLEDGADFDDPVLVARLTGLLDQVVPLVLDHGGFLLGLGNEVDAYFEDYGTAHLDDYARLIDLARQHVHGIAPDLAVGVTLTGTETLAQGEVFQTLQPVTDITPFNYYPIDPYWALLPLDEIGENLEAYLAVFGDRPIVIQELGCNSAESMESSEAMQAACFEVMFQTLAQYPNVRYVTVFAMHDWEDDACDLIVGYFGLTADDLPEPWWTRWRGYLCTLGLVHMDGSPKPAWDVFLAAAGR